MHGFFNQYYNHGQLYLDVAVAVIPVAIALVRGFRPAERWIGDWLRNHDLRLSETTKLELGRHLQRSRRLRTVGFCAGWVAAPAFSIVVHDGRHSPPMLLGWAWLAGYLGAAIVAYLIYARSQRPEGVATLEPRAVSDYLPKWVLVVERAAVPAVALLAVAYAFLPWREPSGFGPSTARYAAEVAFFVPLCLVTFVLQRNVVRRPQPFVADELRVTDDAFRANALHTIAGGFLLVAGGLVTELGVRLGTRVDVQVVRDVAAFSPLAYVASLCLFIGWASPLNAWFVRNRSYSQPHPAA